MEKPYDEVHSSNLYLDQYSGLIRNESMLCDWLKSELQADELEVWKCSDTHGWKVRYKRNQLQYG